MDQFSWTDLLFVFHIVQQPQLVWFTVRSSHCSASATCFIRTLAADAVSLLGRKSRACGFKCGSATGVLRSHSSSNGYKCCTGRSSMLLAVLSWTAHMMPSLPGYTSFTMASGHVPRFVLLVFTMTTSPFLGWNLVTACVRLCLSLSAVRYSLCQGLHILSLQVHRYLARLWMSRSVILQVSSSGNWFVHWYKKVAGVKIGNSMSSFT